MLYIQGVCWINYTKLATLRKHTIRNAIQTVFDQSLRYKKIGSPLQEAFKLIMNSTYGRIIIKDIEASNEYIPNDLVSEYFDTKYNLIEGVYEVSI